MADKQSITKNIDLFMLSGIAMSFFIKSFCCSKPVSLYFLYQAQKNKFWRDNI